MKNETKKSTVHHLIILDESGSMGSICKQTIDMFNKLMRKNAQLIAEFPDQDHRLSFITFNGNGINTVHFNVPMSSERPLKLTRYFPDSSTPLWDAMGSAITRLELKTAGNTNFSVLVSIFTDGMENASREFSGSEIKALVEKCKESGWVFTYFGAEHNIYEAAESLSISPRMCMEYSKHNLEEVSNVLYQTKKLHSLIMQKNKIFDDNLVSEAQKIINKEEDSSA